ncbi:ABC transporter permease [Rathayibacter iranicus]|uniref:ABC transporter permease n=2 Tax=Rathayibacter iranicus TaxID=59737 RepID=A0AAD1AFZ8_9MICO|nr:ABC transporter permease subunit [Rathayibacter iranicus]AZZ55496.1 ABC transporter permease [Rathayibacter iranicus]MWV31675.1 ABC transporter permease subunit [Rathayibacter iranicus NCPPB 2253 = VKM Ac-1602]PPI48285.1 ABC transporter permease [Rathayibacter iranicus]PPI60916.1 ABC transporter permease [Rathayibacter iranicus]PPI72556.1 ABC transporter permease [Rathayibacter iranicus]
MTWVVNNTDAIVANLLAHLALSVPPILLSFVVSLPFGWFANRYRWSRGTLLTGLGVLYAIPSLAMFILLPVLLGIPLRSSANVIIGLTFYGVALMVRTTSDALGAVSQDVRQSATAMGYSGWARFWRVEFPLAGPVLLSGLRVVTVSTVSLVTVGAVLGIQSLGLLFTDGFQRGITGEILTGIVLTIALALVLDGLLVLIGRLLMPWTTLDRARRARGSDAVEKAVIS